jgi:molecular chaperone HtpG
LPLQFKSSKSGEVLTGLDDYISRMKEGQSNIFFIAAENEELAANSPFVEKLVKKDIEVLYFTEPIDEWCSAQLSEYEGKKLVDVTKEGLDVDDDEKSKIEKATKEFQVRYSAFPCVCLSVWSGLMSTEIYNACLV